MYILGISCYYHDAAAALIRDGQLVAAADEERFSRIKHDSDYPRRAIEFCLRTAGIKGTDLDYVVFYEKPFTKFHRIITTFLEEYPYAWRAFGEAMKKWLGQKLWIKSTIMEHLGVPSEKILFSDHHLSHAAAAFLCSPFEKAAILTIDGVGEWTTAAWGQGNGTHIELKEEIRFPHSLGLLYSVFTAFLGFKVNEGEYKVMGLAPYGEPKYVDRVMELLHLADDGSFALDMSYFNYTRSHTRAFSRKFLKIFGPPRERKRAETVEPYYADIAASIQKVTEEIMLRMARYVHEQTGLPYLCMAGGVALNSVANGRILRETPYERLYIQPAAGDAGSALGAALFAYHTLLGHPRNFVLDHAYWGEAHGPASIRAFLEEHNIPYEELTDDEIVERTVEALQQGHVIGWHQGRFEWGPRALGARSILADPRRPEMKDIVNSKIKFREGFRPFAPVVTAEACQTFFELSDADDHYPARFMLFVVPVHESKHDVIPAVTHVDGTARIQVIREDWNPLYYRVVHTFGEATGVPVLLNTSFNLKGEPIVNTPEDAYRTFSRSGIDHLVMGPFWVSKHKLKGTRQTDEVATAART